MCFSDAVALVVGLVTEGQIPITIAIAQMGSAKRQI